MSDIVERLRDQGKDAFAKQYSLGMYKLCDEAAAEIERLRAALAATPAVGGEVLTDKDLWDNSCITRWQIEHWGDDDIAKHATGMRHTVKFLLARLDALAAQQAFPLRGRDFLIEECAKVAEGQLYQGTYRGKAGHNWWHQKQRGNDAEYGNGRHDAAAEIRSLASAAPPEQPAAAPVTGCEEE